MKHEKNNPEQNLEQAVAGLRADQPRPEAADAAGERVWRRVTQEMAASPAVESIRGCGDVRKLLMQYHSGNLPAARKLLVEAHLHECVECRSEAAKGRRPAAAIAPWKQELPRGGSGGLRWAVAAIVLLAAGISVYFLQEAFFAGPAGMRARVQSFDGALFRVGFSGEQPLKVGDEIEEGDMVRTAGGSRAMLRLRDGSLVEMNERAEFGVSMRRNDTTVHLDRGNIIVQAAKRRKGHLYVAARDLNVAVTGTVFSVNSGIKGSRVSVIEGEVHVTETGLDNALHKAVLHPGDQLATDAAGDVPIKKEIAWSRNLGQHLALLAEFAHLENKLQTVQMPGLRYQSPLLPLLPANTVLYASIPNLGDALQQANQLFQQELQESSVLNDWWQQVESRKNAPNFAALVDEIRSLSRYLGEEIVFSISVNGRDSAPLVVARTQQPGLKQFIEQEAASHTKPGNDLPLRVVDEAGLASAAPSGKRSGLTVLVRQDFVAASVDLSVLRRFNAAANQGQGGLASSAFGQRISAAYQQGAGLLFAANLQQIAAEHRMSHPGPRQQRNFESTGLADVQYLVAERKEINGQPLNHAELTFNGPRRGLASWLAAPAPIGGLDFVSKDAGMAAAFVSKSPSQMLDDILSIGGARAQDNLSKAESEVRIRFHQDLADTLGGEAVFALDGPILPTPSWKFVVEVYNPGRLQSTIQQLVTDINEHAKDQDRQIQLDQEAANGLTYYRIHFMDSARPAEVDYTFTDGYLIAAPSRALVMAAIAVHQNGNSLAESDAFRSLLPQDQHADVSALLYQNLAPVLAPVMQQLTPSQLQSLQKIAAESKPSVVCAYGDTNGVRVASNSRFFGLDLNTLALSTLMRMAQPSRSR